MLNLKESNNQQNNILEEKTDEINKLKTGKSNKKILLNIWFNLSALKNR